MADFFTNYFAILFFPLVFLLGKIIYRGRGPLKDLNKSTYQSKYFRVLDNNGEAVEGGYCGWSNLREIAIFDAKQRGLTEDNIHEYNLSAEEAEEISVPAIFLNLPVVDDNNDYPSGRPRDIWSGLGSGIYTGPRGG